MQHEKESVEMVPMPRVLLIGAQKSGTSAIADWLFENGRYSRPKVFEGEPHFYSKEAHFFDIDSRFCKGPQFYSQRFDGSDGMDATPDSLQYAERVHSCFTAAGGNQVRLVKIMVILREPILRELSLYNHLAYDCRSLPMAERTSWNNQVLNSDGTIMKFDEFVEKVSIPGLESNSNFGRSSRHGLYATHLKEWFELFDRSQILVLSYQELQENPGKLQLRVQKFLNRTIPGELARSNSNDSARKLRFPSKKAAESLQRVFVTENEKLYSLLESNCGPSMEERPFPRFPSYVGGKEA